MKTALKYLPIVAIAIVALTWFSVSVRSTEEEGAKLVIDDNHGAREAFRRLLLQDENGQIPPDGLRRALEQKQAMLFRPEAWSEFLQGNGPEIPWVSIGPGNIGGRIRSLIIHPTIPTTMWVGGVAGGVWKTTNGGMSSWSTNTDYLANLAVNCMAIDPANPNILYAGTGEGFFSSDVIRGDGIFKTTNGGTTWRQLDSTRITSTNDDFAWVNRLAISPTNSQLLLAGTQDGLFRSQDGGEIWVQRLPVAGVLDVLFRPPGGTPDVPAINCIAGTRGSGAYYSANNGETWTAATGLPTPTPGQVIPGRVELAYSRSNPSIVYASVEAYNGQLYRSTNGGFSFAYTGPGPTVPSAESEVSWYNNASWVKDRPSAPSGATGASWYNNALWVDPTNSTSNTLIVGGSSLWRTTQGGGGGWAGSMDIHADHHVMVEHPGYDGTTNKIVFGGNDGGVYRTNNVLASPLISWTSLNKNLGITQFYGAAGHVVSGKIIGGTQDNGTLRYLNDPENWTTMYGGDGGYCAVDQTADPYFYGEYIYLQIVRSRNGGDSVECIANIPDAPPARDCLQTTGGNADFIAPFVLDPNNENTMLAGGRSLWRSINVRWPNPSQVSWDEVKPPIPNDEHITAIAIAPANSAVIWVGYNNGAVYFTTNGTASTPTWFQRSNGLPVGRRCTRLTIGNPPQPYDPLVTTTKYATFGGFSSDNVWKTENNGLSWTNISGINRLPSAPVHSLVISASDPNRLYVGTEVGVFASANGGTTWSPSVGDPNAPVFELFWMGPKLVSATHGRGIFTIVPVNP